MSAIYIHYGSKEFDKSKFSSIKNYEVTVKPKGGLWGSQIDAEYGWKEWCENNQFSECKLENSFKFILSDNANVLHINSVNDLHGFTITISTFAVAQKVRTICILT